MKSLYVYKRESDIDSILETDVECENSAVIVVPVLDGLFGVGVVWSSLRCSTHDALAAKRCDVEHDSSLPSITSNTVNIIPKLA